MTPQQLLNATPEEREMLERGADYGDLVVSPGWKRLLDYLALYEDMALADLRKSLSSDPRVAHVLTERWRQRSECLQAIQNEVLGAIEARKQWLEDMKSDPRIRQLVELEEIYGNTHGKP